MISRTFPKRPTTLLAYLSVSLICACFTRKDIAVDEVAPGACVPDSLLIPYVEQMKFLTLKEEPSEERARRLERISDIEAAINEVRRLIEQFRIDYGYGGCGPTE